MYGTTCKLLCKYLFNIKYFQIFQIRINRNMQHHRFRRHCQTPSSVLERIREEQRLERRRFQILRPRSCPVQTP